MLSLDKITILFKKIKVDLINEGNKIYIDERVDKTVPLESHYGVSVQNSNWSYCFYEQERINRVKLSIIKSFNNQETAVNYLFLKQLNRFFMDTYIIPTRNYNVEKWDIDNVKMDMERLSIPYQYLSYEKEVYPNSIVYEQRNKLWYAGYIDKEKHKIFETKNGNEDTDWFLSLYQSDVQMLYLLDQYVTELLEKKEINSCFSNSEKLIILDYI